MNAASMDPAGPAVKPRRYDASRRRAAAERTRARLLDEAERLLLEQGYAATGVPAIATAAGVSPELVYKTFGGKAGLVRAIQQRALEGAGPVPAPDRSDAVAAVAPDARALLAEWARLSTEVAPRVSPVLLLVRSAAATDAALAGLQEEMSDQRLTRMTVNAARLAALPGVRRGFPVERIRDVLWTATSPELYELLVLRRGWTVEEYRDHLFRGLCAQLLEA
jgi:AcrR family transcriptional regulator